MAKKRLPDDCLPRCGTCEFFKQDSPLDEGGSCIRFPRQATVIADEVFWSYPEQDATDCCGEFKRKAH